VQVLDPQDQEVDLKEDIDLKDEFNENLMKEIT